MIIVLAKMSVITVADYLIEERHRWPVITASPRGQSFINRFRICKERDIIVFSRSRNRRNLQSKWKHRSDSEAEVSSRQG